MKHRVEIDQAKANLLKVARTAIRLKHAIAADEELNRVLPALEDTFNRSVQLGELPSPARIVEFLDDED